MLCRFHTSTQVYTVPSLFNLPPTSHSAPVLGVITERQGGPPLIHRTFPLVIWFTPGSVYMSMPLSVRPTLSAPRYPQVHSLCLHLYSCLANRVISTIFLVSIYIYVCVCVCVCVCVNIGYLFVWLTSLCIWCWSYRPHFGVWKDSLFLPHGGVWAWWRDCRTGLHLPVLMRLLLMCFPLSRNQVPYCQPNMTEFIKV